MKGELSPAQRSWRVFPAGSLGEYNLPPELAVVLTRGQGPRVWDASGREYVDLDRKSVV
jgi:4-aminobutyrate aminotransferase-like enzyme